jgi:cytochrome P450
LQTGVAVAQYAAYRSSTNFARPDDFVPERWLDPTLFPGDNKAVLQPFFVGGRNCLGQNIAWAEMRLLVSHMLWNFDIEAVDDLKWVSQKSYYLWQKERFRVRARPAVRF